MNLGIIGNGFIVAVLLDTLKKIKSINVSSLLVRESSLQKGKDLADQYQIEKTFTNIDEFLLDDKIDTVYIGIINSLHFEYAQKCLNAGKNVICEKPFTKTLKEAKHLFELAEKNNVYIFEAITTIHLPTFKNAKENLEKVGKVRIINCSFNQYSSRYDNYLNGNVAPVFKKELFGGALVDLNIYNIHFVVSMFGKPNDVAYFPNAEKNSVDTSGVLVLSYNDFKAVCIGAKDSSLESYAIIQGENGYIKIGSSLNECENCSVITKEDNVHFELNDKELGRMYYELVEFERIIASAGIFEYKALMDETLSVMSVLEKAYSVMK